MALDCHQGTFVAPTANGNYSVTGLGFQPKAIVFFLQFDFSSDSELTDSCYGYGFAVSSTERAACGYVGRNNFSPSDIATVYNNSGCLHLVRTNGLDLLAADFVSMDTDGFTINVTAADATGTKIGYLALGGSDLSQVAVRQHSSDGTTGVQSYSGVGFQPTSALVIGTGGPPFADGLGQNGDGGIFFGAATNSAQGCVGCFVGEGFNPTTSATYQHAGRLIAVPTTAAGTRLEATFQSFDTDGMTLDWQAAQVNRFHVLYMRGPTVKIGTETQKTSTGTKTTNIGFQPKGMLFLSGGVTTGGSPSDSVSLSFGATSGSTARSSMWMEDRDNVSGSSVCRRYFASNKALVFRTAGSTQAAADLSSFDADGFTLDWSTADATAREFLYIAVRGTVTGVEIFADAESSLSLDYDIERESMPISVVADTALSLIQTVNSNAATPDAVSDLSATLDHDVSYILIRSLPTGNTLVLTQDAEFIGPKPASASNQLVLTSQARIPDTITKSASNAIALSQSVGIFGTRRLSAGSQITLAQNADTRFKHRVADTELTLSQTAEYTISKLAASFLLLDQLVDKALRETSTTQLLELSQTASIPYGLSSRLTLSQEAEVERPTAVTIVLDSLTLDQLAVVVKVLGLGPASSLALHQSVGAYVDTTNRLRFQWPAYSLTPPEDGVDRVRFSDIRPRRQANPYLRTYSPIIGEGAAGSPTPPPATLASPADPNFKQGIKLLYPADSPTDTVTLTRSMNLGDTDRLAFDRINRETRGGTLIVFADPIWPKIETLLFTVSAVRKADAANVLRFIRAYLGLEIGLLTHEGRLWKGVVTNPQDAVIQDRRDSFTISIEFQGEEA